MILVSCLSCFIKNRQAFALKHLKWSFTETDHWSFYISIDCSERHDLSRGRAKGLLSHKNLKLPMQGPSVCKAGILPLSFLFSPHNMLPYVSYTIVPQTFTLISRSTEGVWGHELFISSSIGNPSSCRCQSLNPEPFCT